MACAQGCGPKGHVPRECPESCPPLSPEPQTILQRALCLKQSHPLSRDKCHRICRLSLPPHTHRHTYTNCLACLRATFMHTQHTETCTYPCFSGFVWLSFCFQHRLTLSSLSRTSRISIEIRRSCSDIFVLRFTHWISNTCQQCATPKSLRAPTVSRLSSPYPRQPFQRRTHP